VRILKGLRAREVAERLFMAYHIPRVNNCQGDSGFRNAFQNGTE
jgi:hypothetical protein